MLETPQEYFAKHYKDLPRRIIYTADRGRLYDLWCEIEEKENQGTLIPLSFLPKLNSTFFGFDEGEFITVGGRPSNCKTLFMNCVLYEALKKNLKVAYFSYETVFKTFYYRTLAHLTGYNSRYFKTRTILQKIRDGTCNFKEIEKANKWITDHPFYFFQEIGQTKNEFQGLLNLVESGFKAYKPQVILIDHGNLWEKEKDLDKVESINRFLKVLMEVAKGENICVVLAMQIHRASIDKKKILEPVISELKGSGNVEQDSDKIILLHYPFFYSKDEADKGKFVVDGAKSKETPTIRIECQVDPAINRISESPEPYSLDGTPED